MDNIILRNKTAIKRGSLSRPLQIILSSSLVNYENTIFDFGCGLGGDVTISKNIGFEVFGWDPGYCPKTEKRSADVVNLGYVVNVIEDPQERKEALQEAYGFAKKLLIVSARLTLENKNGKGQPYRDGYLTKRNTFQKFYTQSELKDWIDHTLHVRSVPTGPGIFFVFKDETLREEFEANQYRRVSSIPFSISPHELYQKHQAVLQPLIQFYRERGRLPRDEEPFDFAPIKEVFGSAKRAFGVVCQATGLDLWRQVEKEKAEDLLVYLSLSRFGGRPKISSLPPSLQFDIKAHFGTYNKACQKADELLFSAGDMATIDRACQGAGMGKLTHDALYIHESCLPSLPPIIRVYEGCARSYIGQVEDANIIKLHRRKPKVSYLAYPDFEKDPHPKLQGSLVVPLDTFNVQFYDYRHSENPPILHRKEEFIPPDHPSRKKFEKLTKQEEKIGLFEHSNSIGNHISWQTLLTEKGVKLRGHRLVKAS